MQGKGTSERRTPWTHGKICNSRTSTSTRITYSDVKVIARASHYYPRIIRESIEIMKNTNNFNREDGYRISNTWKLALRNHHTPSDATHRIETVMDQQNGTVTDQQSGTGMGYITRSKRRQHQSLENF